MTKRHIIYSYLKNFIIFSITAIIAFFLSEYCNIHQLLNKNLIKSLQIGSSVIDATIIFGAPEWKIQTWGGQSYSESFNQSLIKFITAIAFFITIFSWQLI